MATPSLKEYKFLQQKVRSLETENQELNRRLNDIHSKRILSKWRDAKMWKVPAIGESLIDIGTDQCIMAGGKFWREDLVVAHNNDIVALNHCADILTDELSGLDNRMSKLRDSVRVDANKVLIGEKQICWADNETVGAEIVDVIKSALARY